MPGVSEVFHAQFLHHAYPMHTHDTWTLLVIDDGAIEYELGPRRHGAVRADVTLLPPHVPHDGRAATSRGFRKRVVYLDSGALGEAFVGRAVDAPHIHDAALRARIDLLHRALVRPGDELAAESQLALVLERLRSHLARRTAVPGSTDRSLAGALREILDASIARGVRLSDAAATLGVDPAHLVRSFTHRYGLPPHRYLVGRRVDAARQLLLDGRSPAEVAAATGFYDQSHLTRHFRAQVGTTPARFAGRSGGPAPRAATGRSARAT